MAWSRLPQGFKDSPILCGGSPSGGFVNFPGRNPSYTLLQYMDDLLLASQDWEKCWEGTKALLVRLSEVGYKVSWKKGQVCQQEV
jgi:hypothetical protein